MSTRYRVSSPPSLAPPVPEKHRLALTLHILWQRGKHQLGSMGQAGPNGQNMLSCTGEHPGRGCLREFFSPAEQYAYQVPVSARYTKYTIYKIQISTQPCMHAILEH
jgi:hypothetical protein